MSSIVINTCLGCNRKFESNFKKDFCSSYCRWKHGSKNQSDDRQADEKELWNKFRILSIFEDVRI